MPTAAQLEIAARTLIETSFTNPASCDWVFGNAADETRLLYADVTNSVFVGRSEIEPQLEMLKKYGKINGELVAPISAYPNLLGTISLVHTVVKYTAENAVVPSQPSLSNTRDVFLLFDANCKLLRLQYVAKGEETRKLATELRNLRAKAAGVPEGGFPEAIKALEIALKSSVSGKAAAELTSDDALYFPIRGQILNKNQMVAFIDAMEPLGFEGLKRVDEIRTPDRNSAWTNVVTAFKDPTVMPEEARLNAPNYYGLKVGPDGKSVRIVQLAYTVEGYKNAGKLAEFVMSQMQAKAGTGA